MNERMATSGSTINANPDCQPPHCSMVSTMARKKHDARVRPQTQNLPSRNNFDWHWLNVEDESKVDRGFIEQRALEHDGSRPIIQPFLTEAIQDHHISRRRIAKVLADLGFSAASEFLAHNLPKDEKTRKGNFGEVVASEHLVQRYGYYLPVFKLRHRDSDLPMRGEDIIAFELSDAGHIVRIVIGEAKAHAQFRSSTVSEAHKRLMDSYQPWPMTLSMIANILAGHDNIELAAEVDRISMLLTERDFPCAHWIFLINENYPKDPFTVLQREGEIVDNLFCVAVTLPEMTALVNALFEAGPVLHEEPE